MLVRCRKAAPERKKKKMSAPLRCRRKKIIINSKEVRNYFLNNRNLIQAFVTFAVPKRESNYYLEDNADEQVRMEKTAFTAEISLPLR